ncbi:MAG TPA: hypothetical protein VM432_06905, partial [Bdellovibrionales bacterium]|nr:hypothetical protein [Bdellovibrionales bacterium]
MLIASIRITMLSLLTFIALFHSAYASAQKSQCAAVFGTFRAAFNHNTAYSTEILERTPIKDQKNLGTCHLHSWAANLERSYFLRTGKTIELSASFLTAVHLFTNATQNLKADNIDQRIYLGSGALKSKSTIAQIGLIPAAIWKPSRDFQSNPMADQLETYFQNILTRTIIKKNAADTEERKAEILERAEKDILKIIESFVGPMPSSFEYESRK